MKKSSMNQSSEVFCCSWAGKTLPWRVMKHQKLPACEIIGLHETNIYTTNNKYKSIFVNFSIAIHHHYTTSTCFCVNIYIYADILAYIYTMAWVRKTMAGCSLSTMASSMTFPANDISKPPFSGDLPASHVWEFTPGYPTFYIPWLYNWLSIFPWLIILIHQPMS